MQPVMGQPIKKKFFLSSPVSAGDHPLAKESEEDGYEIVLVVLKFPNMSAPWPWGPWFWCKNKGGALDLPLKERAVIHW